MRTLVQLLAVLLLAAGLVGWLRSRPDEGSPDGAGADEELRAPSPPRDAAREEALLPEARRGAPESGSPRPDADPGAAERVGLNERGVAALAAGEVPEAVELFERCLAGDPDQPVVRRNLAEALARWSRAARYQGAGLAKALERLERAVELAPERDDLARELARLREEVEAEASFSTFESHYFELSFDGDRAALVSASQEFLDRLERAYADLAEWFEHDPVLEGRAPFPVRLYEREAFAALTGLGHWAAGAFDGTIRLPLTDEDVGRAAWSRTLRHELVHAFVRELGGTDVPGWLNEGLAQWLEPGARAAAAAAAERLREHPWPELATLSGSLLASGDPETIRRAYDRALVLVERLERDWGRDILLALVHGCAGGGAPPETFRRLTGVELGRIVRDLEEERSF